MLTHQTQANLAGQKTDVRVCSMCGAITGDFWQTVPSRLVKLQSRPRYGDRNERWIVCDECHEGLQDLSRHNIALPKPDRIHLLTQIRRATIPDQKAVLDWLLQKYNLEAKKKKQVLKVLS